MQNRIILILHCSLLVLTILTLNGCITSKKILPRQHLNQQECAWQKLRSTFSLPVQDTSLIQENLNWFASNPGFINDLVRNSTPFLSYIIDKLQEKNLPTELALLPMIESDFNPFAHSIAGAAGIWQLMPGTASGYGVEQNWWFDGRKDVITSTKAAIRYLCYLHKTFNDDWLLAIAAYNSGEGTIKNAIRKNKRLNKRTDYWSLDLPRQTKQYVPKLLALVALINMTNDLPEFTIAQHFKVLSLSRQIDFKVIAKLSQTPLVEIIRLNAGYNRLLTSPKGPHKIAIPLHNIPTFINNYHALPDDQHINYQHRVLANESLSSIAKHYGTSVQTIKSLNNLSSDLIRVNQQIIVPASTVMNRQRHELNGKQYLADQHYDRSPLRKINYVVKKHDSYHRIAKKFGVSIGAIEFWNGVSHHKPIVIGDPLTMWIKKSRKTYKVKSGDTLSQIAKAHNTTTETLLKNNQLTSIDKIKIGDELIIVN